MNNNPIYIIREQFTDSWDRNHLCKRILTDSGYFVSLDAALAKAFEYFI